MKQFSFSVVFLLSFFVNASEPGYFRHPDLAGDLVVFTAEGDLWLTDINGLQAKRLTTHTASETQACFSPDGSKIAFVANYEGASEIYMIPTAGGLATRITYENSRVSLQDWTQDGHILYATNTQVGMPDIWALRKVDPSNLQAETLPLADANQGSISRDGTTLVFTRFGLHQSNDNARIYRGGAEGELWSYRVGSNKEAQPLTKTHRGDARLPMVGGTRIFFISDASGSDQVWSMAFDGSDFQQVTKDSEWPIRQARIDGDRIIFQQGADLKLLNLIDGNIRTINIRLTSDFPNLRTRWINDPLEYVTSTRLGGKEPLKVAVTARGQVALAVADGSRLVEVQTPAHSRTRNAVLGPDGRWVYALNDSTGFNEIWRFPVRKGDRATALTKDNKDMIWSFSLAPDGKSLFYDTNSGELWLLNLEDGTTRKVMDQNGGPFSDVVWSHDSRFVAITRTHLDDERGRVLLMDRDGGKQTLLTSDKYNSFSPTFSRDSSWLYFLSDRHFNPTPSGPWGDRNMGAQFDKRTQIFAVSLVADAEFPFEPHNELKAEKQLASSQADKKEDEESKLQVEWSGIQQRLWQVPIDAGNYSNLQASDANFYLLERNEGMRHSDIRVIKIEQKPKLETFATGVAQYELSMDGKSMLVRKNAGRIPSLFIVKAGSSFPKDTSEASVETRGWQLRIDPRDEWRQMFHDAWLMHAAFLYDPAMRGQDWQAIKEKYRPLVERLTDRHELNDLLSQMMGEVYALHSQIRPGDVPEDEDAPRIGVLGCQLDQTKQGVRIRHIYGGDPERPEALGPLSKPGVDARKDDVIIEINGTPTVNLNDVHEQLLNQVGKQVVLTLQRGKAIHKTVVLPGSTRSDSIWRYRDWVFSNQAKVHRDHPDIGYLHLRAMGSRDLANFAREFYGQIRKQGMIIDVRRNRGGNVDSLIIEKLLRKVWAFWQPPSGDTFTNMQQTFRGHLVVLADQGTYSDGETFTAGIKALKLGKVIGKRTAGAGVWLSDFNWLVDRGMTRVAQYPQYAADGRWIVEGYGVEPDIEVENLPLATFNGKDAQLDAAVSYLREKIKSEPVMDLKPQPIPQGDRPADDVLLD